MARKFQTRLTVLRRPSAGNEEDSGGLLTFSDIENPVCWNKKQCTMIQEEYSAIMYCVQNIEG